MERMGLVVRKAKKLPPNFEDLKKVTISSTAEENSIPADLIVNWDQTGVGMAPVNDWTMPATLNRSSK